jgi:hypothetical protein
VGTGTGKISMTTENDTVFGNGSLTGTSTLEIAGNKVIDVSASPTLANVSLISGKTLTNNGTLTINNLLGADATSTFVNLPGSTLIINGALLATGTFDASTCSNTVIYNGNIAQTIKPATYCNVIMRGGGAKTFIDGAALTAHGDVTQDITVPVTNVTVGTATWQIDGTLTTGNGFVNNGDISIGN